jgi:hypothetical protein
MLREIANLLDVISSILSYFSQIREGCKKKINKMKSHKNESPGLSPGLIRNA